MSVPPLSTRPLHPAQLPRESLLAACEVRRQRRSGPGGQHRNKVETAVVLVHRESGIRAEASERRSQAENLSVALFRMRVKLAVGVRTEVALAGYVPAELWRHRAAGGRIACSVEHADFPTLLADALDVLAASDADVRRAAVALGVSMSQLARFIAGEPSAFAKLNAWRASRGLRPLR